MELSAHEIAELFGGRIEGDPAIKITGLAKIEEGEPGLLSFLANPKYESHLYSTRSGIVLIPEGHNLSQQVDTTLIYLKDPYTAFSVLLEKFNPPSHVAKRGAETPSYLAEGVVLDPSNYVGAFSYLSSGVKLGLETKIYPHVFIGENVTIGDYSVIYPGVKIYENCVIGSRVMIHSGTIIGADGFGFAPQKDGSFKKIMQTGNVVLEDDVEVGANCSIDRATVGSTLIKKGVKLDNLIQIAHNVEIGNNTVIAAQTGISGSTKIAENCLIGGQVGIVGHIQIAAGTQVGAQSGIGKTISRPAQKFRGSPVQPYSDALRSEVIYRNLPEISKRLDRLEGKSENSAEGLDG